DSFWMTEEFNFGSAFSDLVSQELSPFFMIEARISFLLSLLFNDASTYFSGVPVLSSFIFRLRCSDYFESDNHDGEKWNEYSHQKVGKDLERKFSQMVFWDDVDLDISRMEEHGRVIIVSTKKMPLLISGLSTEETNSFPADSEIGEFY